MHKEKIAVQTSKRLCNKRNSQRDQVIAMLQRVTVEYLLAKGYINRHYIADISTRVNYIVRKKDSFRSSKTYIEKKCVITNTEVALNKALSRENIMRADKKDIVSSGQANCDCYCLQVEELVHIEGLRALLEALWPVWLFVHGKYLYINRAMEVKSNAYI
jgi:hypothetical protein